MHIEKLNSSSDDRYFHRIAQIHKQEIEAGFLSTLGDRFLNHLYRSLAGSPDAFLLAAIINGEVLGFLCGATSTRRVYRHVLRKHMLRMGLVLLPKLFSWKRVRRIFETLAYAEKDGGETLPEAEILNFCVARGRQGTGVGRQLFLAMQAEFQHRDVAAIRIVTGQNQSKAQKFYESAGATRVKKIEIHEGIPSLVYRFAIPRVVIRPFAA